LILICVIGSDLKESLCVAKKVISLIISKLTKAIIRRVPKCQRQRGI